MFSAPSEGDQRTIISQQMVSSMDDRRWMGMNGVQKNYVKSGDLTDRRRKTQRTVGVKFRLTVRHAHATALYNRMGQENRPGDSNGTVLLIGANG